MFRYVRFSILSLAIFAVVPSATAQIKVTRPSPRASVMQTIGVTDLTITYSRPAVKGRVIWGEAPPDAHAKGEATLDDQDKRPGMPIVPYGHVWRTGANEATQFVVTDDVLVNGQKLAAGSYSLHTIPGKDEWILVFNGTANQWGSFSYDPKKDTIRVKAKPQTVADNQEYLSFHIEPAKENAAMVNLRWEKLKIPFTVEVADVAAITLIRARESVAAAKPDDFRTPYSAAMFAKRNKADADAAGYFERALKAVDVSIATKETFQNLSARANILFGAGRRDEGLAAAEKAIAKGKADKVDTASFEKRVADIKAGKL